MAYSPVTQEIAAEAARLIADSGLEYGPAKVKAAKALGQRRAELPSNEQVEDELREHLALFCGDTQPQELRALREVALQWMERLEAFRPHLGGAVWRGTATRLNAVHIDLYCDDPKSAPIALLNSGVDHDVDSVGSGPEPTTVLTLAAPCAALGERVTVHLLVRDADDLRGALKPDSRGQSWRGDTQALRRLLQAPVEKGQQS
jgi:hypothetical protein